MKVGCSAHLDMVEADVEGHSSGQEGQQGTQLELIVQDGRVRLALGAHGKAGACISAIGHVCGVEEGGADIKRGSRRDGSRVAYLPPSLGPYQKAAMRGNFERRIGSCS